MKKLISLLLLITSLSFAQNPVTQKRCFWGDKNPVTSPPTWSSKFLTGDYYLYSKDSSIYTYNSVSKVWALAVNGLRGGGGGRYLVTCVINGTGSLMAYYSDGTQDNLGVVVGMDGKDGSNGQNGLNGTNGANGQAATITVRNTTTLPAGSSAIVTNVGTSSNAVLDFGIPQGKDGSGGSGGNISVYVSTLQMLKSAQTTGIAVVMSFHAGSGYGSGMWYVDGNTSQADFVNHFKNSAGTSCWHRVSPKPCLDDVDFGAPSGTKTLGQYGYTQTDINLLYDATYAITTGDYADDAAHITTGKGWLKNYMCISQSPVIINTKRDVDLGKKNTAYANAEIFNSGNGQRVNMLGTNQTGYKRKAASWTESENDNDFAGATFNYSGYVVVGIEGANQTFINTDASFGMTTRMMHVNSVDYPFVQYHCMQTELSNINVWSPKIGFQNLSMTGLYPDANSSNSGGNMVLYSNTRVYCTPRTTYGWKNFESSSPVWQNTISEGPAGGLVASVLVENGNATVTKDAVIRTIHLENMPTATGSQIQLKTQREFTFTLADVWSQGSGTLVSLQGSNGSPRIFMDRTPWIRGKDVKFDNAGTTAQWNFLDTQVFDGDLNESAYWVGGVVPAWLKIEGMGIQCYQRTSTYNYKVNGGGFMYNSKDVLTKP